MEDLAQAIRTARQAVEVTPEDHLDLAGWLNNLGTKLEGRTGRMERSRGSNSDGTTGGGGHA